MESIAVLPWLTHFVHLLAAIVWIGGLAYHFPVMKSSLRNLDAAAARRMSSVAFVRFRMISLLAIAAVALTGLHMAAGIVRGTGPATAETGGFFGSPYGLILGLKINALLMSQLFLHLLHNLSRRGDRVAKEFAATRADCCLRHSCVTVNY